MYLSGCLSLMHYALFCLSHFSVRSLKNKDNNQIEANMLIDFKA